MKNYLPTFSTRYTQLQGNPFSPVCLVIRVFPIIFGITCFTSSGVERTCTPPLKLFSLKNPNPLPPVCSCAFTA